MREQHDRYSFPDTVAGLTQMMEFSLARRRNGFKTFARVRLIGPTVLRVLVVVQPSRPNRAARGCELRRA